MSSVLIVVIVIAVVVVIAMARPQSRQHRGGLTKVNLAGGNYRC